MIQLPRRRPRLAAALAGVAVAAGLLSGCAGKDAVAQGSGNASGYEGGDGAARTIPASDRVEIRTLSGRALDGSRVDLADWKGDVVVVNFWASWCAPCIAEADGLQAVYAQTRALGVRFLGVDIKDSAANARAFVRKHHIGYPSLDDQPDRSALAFKPPPGAIPSTIILDRRHREAVRISGAVTYTRLLGYVRAVAAEAAT